MEANTVMASNPDRTPSPLDDVVLSVEDARAHLHGLVAAVRDEQREFLVGPRRRAVARISPLHQSPAGAGNGVTWAGKALETVLALMADALGYAMSVSHHQNGALTVPAGTAAVAAALPAHDLDWLVENTLSAFLAADGDPAVTSRQIRDALTR